MPKDDNASNDALEDTAGPIYPVVRVTKLEAARRELDMAVAQFFADGDEVGVHTLTAAARELLEDLALREERKSLVESMIDLVVEDKRTEFRNRILEPQNFMKHADRDPDAILEFSPFITHMLLRDAVWLYCVLSGEKIPLFNLFSIWFVVAYPAANISEEVKVAAREASTAYDPTDRQRFLELLPEIEKLDQ